MSWADRCTAGGFFYFRNAAHASKDAGTLFIPNLKVLLHHVLGTA